MQAACGHDADDNEEYYGADYDSKTLAQVQAASPPGSGQGGEKGAAAVGGKIGKLEQKDDDDDGDDNILSNKPSKGSLTSKLAEISYLPKLAKYQGSTNSRE